MVNQRHQKKKRTRSTYQETLRGTEPEISEKKAIETHQKSPKVKDTSRDTKKQRARDAKKKRLEGHWQPDTHSKRQ